MGYTRQQILDECEKKLSSVNTFYQVDVANYLGTASDTGEPYTEVVAEFFLNNISAFQSDIKQITRLTSYRTESHNGDYSASSNRIEEIIAMQMFNYCKDGAEYDLIGRIMDYQTPLKSKRSDKAGKIDMIAYDGRTVRLLELKKPDSKETMLRCVLEAYTYLKTVDTAKLLEDFKLPSNTHVTACPFVFKWGNQWAELQENRPQLVKLISVLGSKPFYITESNNFYQIEE